MKVTKGKNGETKELTLGKIKITSHIYHDYQQIWLEMDDCSLKVSPRWNNIGAEVVTAISITAKKPHTVKHEKNYIWVNIYPNREAENDKRTRANKERGK